MKKRLVTLSVFGVIFLFTPSFVFAADLSPVTQYTTDILGILIPASTLIAAIFLVRGGYSYITSSGNPQALESAKKTIRNALIGLAIVIGASAISSILNNAFTTPVNSTNTGALALTPIQPVTPSNGFTQAMIDGFIGVIQNLIQSGAKPLIDGVISFLTTTPQLATNSVVFNFWLVILGITDTLFVIVIALLGFHVMSASTFGYEEIDLKQVLGRLILAFLGANISIFLIDRIIALSNALVNTVLNATGGLTHAWVLTLFDPTTVINHNYGLFTLIFMLLFLILTIVLLLYYIGRLVIISLGAVLSPLIFLAWALPAGEDFATIAAKTYIISIFTVFVHVVTIQLASAFLSVADQNGTNTLISFLVGIGLFFTLLKIPGMLINLAFYTAASSAIRKIGGQVMNVFSSNDQSNSSSANYTHDTREIKKPAREVAL